jgi:hypothetical protein
VRALLHELQGFTSVIEDCDPFHAKKVFELAVDMVGAAGGQRRGGAASEGQITAALVHLLYQGGALQALLQLLRKLTSLSSRLHQCTCYLRHGLTTLPCPSPACSWPRLP